VRHYFGQYEEGEERPAAVVAGPTHGDETAMNGAPATAANEHPSTGESSSMEKTPEEIPVAEAGSLGKVEEVRDLSTEEIVAAEEAGSASDAFSDADAREEAIELDNDAVDSLVNESQEVSDEGIDGEGNDRG
jgi:N utilization substance protein A